MKSDADIEQPEFTYEGGKMWFCQRFKSGGTAFDSKLFLQDQGDSCIIELRTVDDGLTIIEDAFLRTSPSNLRKLGLALTKFAEERMLAEDESIIGDRPEPEISLESKELRLETGVGNQQLSFWLHKPGEVKVSAVGYEDEEAEFDVDTKTFDNFCTNLLLFRNRVCPTLPSDVSPNFTYRNTETGETDGVFVFDEQITVQQRMVYNQILVGDGEMTIYEDQDGEVCIATDVSGGTAGHQYAQITLPLNQFNELMTYLNAFHEHLVKKNGGYFVREPALVEGTLLKAREAFGIYVPSEVDAAKASDALHNHFNVMRREELRKGQSVDEEA